VKDLISFFTQIPVHGEIERVVEQIWMLPLLALLTSFPSMVFLYLELPLKNILAVIALYCMTGLIHLDGLADFSDGIMAKGTRENKIRAMKDVNIGIAGLSSAMFIILLQTESLRLVPFYSILVAELNSKFSMLLAISTGKSAGDGIGNLFIKSFRKFQIFYGTTLFFLIFAVMTLLDVRNLYSLLSLSTILVILPLSVRNFGGLTGDCIGATAELTRAVSLLILAGIHNL
jgi:adenosylcobinamide-GDP ribazoletransferase